MVGEAVMGKGDADRRGADDGGKSETVLTMAVVLEEAQRAEERGRKGREQAQRAARAV